MVLPTYSYGLGIGVWMNKERLPSVVIIFGLGVAGRKAGETTGPLCYSRMVNLVSEK